ncbi:hypothetical protein B0H14DRAFT_3888800 [Mycena olivaceomarginata]|nr:hypothetical protein B0H14DRAFT_3888800 [Mycena olivaceomarginata]
MQGIPWTLRQPQVTDLSKVVRINDVRLNDILAHHAEPVGELDAEDPVPHPAHSFMSDRVSSVSNLLTKTDIQWLINPPLASSIPLAAIHTCPPFSLVEGVDVIDFASSPTTLTATLRHRASRAAATRSAPHPSDITALIRVKSTIIEGNPLMQRYSPASPLRSCSVFPGVATCTNSSTTVMSGAPNLLNASLTVMSGAEIATYLIATQTNLCAALPTKLDDSGRGKGRRNVVLAQCSRGVSRSLADACPCVALTCLSLQTARCTKGDVCDFTLAPPPSPLRNRTCERLRGTARRAGTVRDFIAALPAPRARLLPPQPPDNLGDCPRTQLIFQLACKCHATISSASFRTHTRHSGFKARNPASYCPEGPLSHWLSYAGCRVAVPAPLYSHPFAIASSQDAASRAGHRSRLRIPVLAYHSGILDVALCGQNDVPQTAPSPSCRPPGSTSVPLSAFQRRRFPAQPYIRHWRPERY